MWKFKKKKKIVKCIFSFDGCKETTTAKENSTVLSPIGLYDDASSNDVVGWSIRAYSIRITQKKVYSVYVEGCKYLQQTVFHSGLPHLVIIFFSLICDAFAQSELTPLNPDKCNNALYSSELLNARFLGTSPVTIWSIMLSEMYKCGFNCLC